MSVGVSEDGYTVTEPLFAWNRKGNLTMKRAVILLLMLLLLNDSGCAAQEEIFGLSPQDFTVVAESDSHGGFLGDGLYVLTLDCAQNRDKALETVSVWNALPLSENLQLMLYGTDYTDGLAQEAGIPQIDNGWYRFEDRHDQSKDPADDTALFNRFSYNFSLAIYDADADRLYYLEFDT